jgi:hypothetical protein
MVKKIKLKNNINNYSLTKMMETHDMIKETKKKIKKEIKNETKKNNNKKENDMNLISNINNDIEDVKINFNNLINKAINKENFKLVKNNKNSKKLYNNYEYSFDDIISFAKKFTKTEINNINTIVYHDENNDGMFSAAIAYHYLKENNKNSNILLIGEKPGKNKFVNKIKDKNVLILDLSINEYILNQVEKSAKSFIIIDDHNQRASNNKNVFNGNNHSACGYTWKFFYPKENIPKTILYIDSSDGKLFLSFIPHSYSTLIAQSMGIRYTHAKSKKIMENKQSGEFFIQLWNIIKNEKILKLLISIGYYYHQASESLKEQIAINASPMKFQGYNVGVLNFNSPALSKPVARQIITNFKNKGLPIDFAVLWGYEYTSNAYRIQLMDDHKQTKIKMNEIADKLGELGGSQKKGFGHAHVGNFYWVRKQGQDIWSLFEKQYI